MKKFIQTTAILSGLLVIIPFSLAANFNDALSTAQETASINPQTPKNAGGNASFHYDKQTHLLQFTIHYHNLSGSATMSHFHLGATHTAGPVLQTICGSNSLIGPCPKGSTGTLGGSWRIPANQQAAFKTQQVYINIHTDLNPKGEVRGQVTP